MTTEERRSRATARLAVINADGQADPKTAEAIILRAVINGTDRAELAAQLGQLDPTVALAAVDAAVGALILTMNDFLELHPLLHVPTPWPFDTLPTSPRDRLVRRAADRLARMDSGSGEVSPEELILRAFIDGTDRDDLVRRLSVRSYSFPEFAPFPHEGKTHGTWDEVEEAVIAGFLSEQEYVRIHSAVKPPTAQ